MCIAALPALGAIVSAAGTAFSFVAQMQQAKTQEKIGERNAKLEEYRGRYEARQLEKRLRYAQGEATAQAGANGIGLDGSFLDIISDNEVQGEIDAENARRNSYNEAGNIRAEARAAASRSRAGAVSTLIGGAGSFLKAVA